MIYSKNKPFINKLGIKKNYIYDLKLKKPNSNSLKETTSYSIISDIFKYTYEDYFATILKYESKEKFQNIIEEKALEFIKNNFNEQETKMPFIKISIKKIKDKINNKINKDYSYLTDSLDNIKKFPKKVKYLSHFRKHCNKTDDIACHLCKGGETGKLIEVKSKYSLDTNFVICNNCNYCYEKNFIKMFCENCNKNYFSEILKENEDVNCLPASWDNYHCGTRIKETMKCIKCKSILYLDIKNNELICKNKNCNFCVKPENLVWQCHLCKSEFRSSAKIYNPLEFDIVKKVIKRAILYRNRAYPSYLPCCNGNLNEKTIFYHKKECKGELFQYFLNYIRIVVCEKCHALNNYEKFSWLCPFCGTTLIFQPESNYNFKEKGHNKNIVDFEDVEFSPLKKSYKDYDYKNNNYHKSNDNILKTSGNALLNNFYNLKYYMKKNQSNDISYDRERKFQNSSQDFSLINNENKSSINFI